MRLCTVCGVLTSRPVSRCNVHARQSNRRQAQRIALQGAASAANERKEDPVDDLDQGRVGDRRLGHDQLMADKVHR
jgi:hypothetical protein